MVPFTKVPFWGFPFFEPQRDVEASLANPVGLVRWFFSFPQAHVIAGWEYKWLNTYTTVYFILTQLVVHRVLNIWTLSFLDSAVGKSAER